MLQTNDLSGRSKVPAEIPAQFFSEIVKKFDLQLEVGPPTPGRTVPGTPVRFVLISDQKECLTPALPKSVAPCRCDVSNPLNLTERTQS